MVGGAGSLENWWTGLNTSGEMEVRCQGKDGEGELGWRGSGRQEPSTAWDKCCSHTLGLRVHGQPVHLLLFSSQ